MGNAGKRASEPAMGPATVIVGRDLHGQEIVQTGWAFLVDDGILDGLLERRLRDHARGGKSNVLPGLVEGTPEHAIASQWGYRGQGSPSEG